MYSITIVAQSLSDMSQVFDVHLKDMDFDEKVIFPCEDYLAAERLYEELHQVLTKFGFMGEEVAVKFKDLAIGDEFDFLTRKVGYNSFFGACVKISPRKYRSGDFEYQVGSINCVVNKGV